MLYFLTIAYIFKIPQMGLFTLIKQGELPIKTNCSVWVKLYRLFISCKKKKKPPHYVLALTKSWTTRRARRRHKHSIWLTMRSIVRSYRSQVSWHKARQLQIKANFIWLQSRCARSQLLLWRWTFSFSGLHSIFFIVSPWLGVFCKCLQTGWHLPWKPATATC